MQKEFVNRSEEQVHEKRFSRVMRLQEKRDIDVPSDPFKSEWPSILPSSQYGDVALPSGQSAFIKEYKEALEEGNADAFVMHAGEDDYSNIYRVKSGSGENEKDRQVIENYNPQNLHQIKLKLLDFLSRIENSQMPDEYKNEYRDRIEKGELKHIELARTLASPDFTVLQKTPEEWGNFIDSHASVEEGTVVLPYERLAREMLMKGKALKEKGNVPKKTLNEALSFWDLSTAEKAEIGYDNITDSDEKLSTDQTTKLLGLFLRRFHLDNWKAVIDPGVTAINDAAKEKELQVPKDRQFDGGDIIYISGHETDHSVSVENGERQEHGLLWEGMYDYLKTEEGKAAANELILGLVSTDARQIKLFGRYMAVSMALKAEMVNGKPVPKHSTQDIYDELISSGVSTLDAKDIMWRIMRGTSLSHQGVMLPVKTKDHKFEIPAAECYVKDALYFEGQQEVFEWLKENMPVKAGHRKAVTTDTSEFSDKALARVGLKSYELEAGKVLKLKYSEAKNEYPNWVKKGRASLFTINNLLATGKVRLDMLGENSFWEKNLRFGSANGQIDLQNIFTPREE
jgi:hypothetical protein